MPFGSPNLIAVFTVEPDAGDCAVAAPAGRITDSASTTRAVVSATDVPSNTPATASDSQCAARYARDSAMRIENATAAAPHAKRFGPSGNSAMTAATVVTDAATAWPDGKDPPLMWTRGWGGRGRW